MARCRPVRGDGAVRAVDGHQVAQQVDDVHVSTLRSSQLPRCFESLLVRLTRSAARRGGEAEIGPADGGIPSAVGLAVDQEPHLRDLGQLGQRVDDLRGLRPGVGGLELAAEAHGGDPVGADVERLHLDDARSDAGGEPGRRLPGAGPAIRASS